MEVEFLGDRLGVQLARDELRVTLAEGVYSLVRSQSFLKSIGNLACMRLGVKLGEHHTAEIAEREGVGWALPDLEEGGHARLGRLVRYLCVLVNAGEDPFESLGHMERLDELWPRLVGALAPCFPAARPFPDPAGHLLLLARGGNGEEAGAGEGCGDAGVGPGPGSTSWTHCLLLDPGGVPRGRGLRILLRLSARPLGSDPVAAQDAARRLAARMRDAGQPYFRDSRASTDPAPLEQGCLDLEAFLPDGIEGEELITPLLSLRSELDRSIPELRQGLDHRLGQRRPVSVHAADQRPPMARGAAPPASGLQPPASAPDEDGRNDDQCLRQVETSIHGKAAKGQDPGAAASGQMLLATRRPPKPNPLQEPQGGFPPATATRRAPHSPPLADRLEDLRRARDLGLPPPPAWPTELCGAGPRDGAAQSAPKRSEPRPGPRPGELLADWPEDIEPEPEPEPEAEERFDESTAVDLVLVSPGPLPNKLKRVLSILLSLDYPRVGELLSKTPVVLLRGTSPSVARRYGQVLRQAAGRYRIQAS